MEHDRSKFPSIYPHDMSSRTWNQQLRSASRSQMHYDHSSYFSVCSSATTISSASCPFAPSIPAMPNFRGSPSFDVGLGKPSSACFDGGHHHPAMFGSTFNPASQAPPQSGLPWTAHSLQPPQFAGYAAPVGAERYWKPQPTITTHPMSDASELEEFSLGSGYPGSRT